MPPGPGHQRAHHDPDNGWPFVRPTLSARPSASGDFRREFLARRTEKLFGGKQRAAPSSGRGSVAVWALRRRQQYSQQLAPLTVPSQSLPGQPCCSARPAPPVETPAPAPLRWRRLLHLHLNLHPHRRQSPNRRRHLRYHRPAPRLLHRRDTPQANPAPEGCGYRQPAHRQ